ncbi:MAG: hypothetical protein IT340_02130 [Chloroflexi bacterium]|nr:hypothetical protein [Chloroflexota bacterium]
MRRYRIPTHLAVEPSLVRAELGPIPVDLTFRQAAALACAAGFAYWLWQGSGLPTAVVVALALGAVLIAALAGFVTVGARSADLWLLDLLHYAARPRRLVWRPALPVGAGEPPAAWAATPIALAWRPAGPAVTATPVAASPAAAD